MVSKKVFYTLYNRNSQNNTYRSIGDILNKKYRREVSLPIAYFFAKKNISANATTLLFFIIGLIANILFIYPSIYTIFALFILYEVVQILDCVDGQLARYYGTFSIYGDLLDMFTELILSSTFIAFFGIRIYLSTSNPIFLIIGSLGAISYVLEGLWVKNSSNISGELGSRDKMSLFDKLRMIYISLDNMTFISIGTLLIAYLQDNFNNSTIIPIVFTLYVVFLLFIKIIFRLVLIYNKAESVSKKTWTGWK